MKRFLLVLALAAVAGATYVATAPGSQTAGPTMAQFRALKIEVTKLKRDEGKVKQLALTEGHLLVDCMAIAVPVEEFGEGNGFASTYGYTWTDPAQNSGTPWLETALDFAASDDPSAIFMTGGTAACGTDINPALQQLGRLTGIHVQHLSPRAFSAHRR